MNYRDAGISDSLTAVVTGTTPPMRALRPSTSTTRGAIATATSGRVPLLYTPDACTPSACTPVQLTKGPADLAEKAAKYRIFPLRLRNAAQGELFASYISFDQLYKAWKRVRKGKAGDPAIAKFELNLEPELIQLQNELIWDTWEPAPYETFKVYEPKERLIYAPAIRDRVIHHALYSTMEPLVSRVYARNSFACQVGKGAHAGASAAENEIKRLHRKGQKVWALKGDISKYFESIDRERMKELIRARYKCQRTVQICEKIIDCSPGEKGLPLGNLTSQLFANLYLHELDHFVINILQVPGYFRYMDDWVILGSDKSSMLSLRIIIGQFLWRELRLTCNPKTAIFPVDQDRCRSVDFLGYHLYGTHRRLRRGSVRKGIARANDYALDPSPHNLNRLTSWYAHARHAEPTGMMRQIFQILTQSKIYEN